MENQITPVQRDITVITSEINFIMERTRTTIEMTALEGSVEVGRRLHEAKAALPHGEWGKWLSEGVNFSQKTAERFMKLFEELGDEKGNARLLFSNSTALSNLPMTKVLQLLSVPAEDREDFVAENDVVEMSSRELAQAIKERDEAREEARKAREDAKAGQAAIREKETLEGAVKRAREHVDEANARAEAAEQAAAEAKEAAKKKNDRAIANAVKKAVAEEAAKAAETEKTLAAAQKELEDLRKKDTEREARATEEKEKAVADIQPAAADREKGLLEKIAALEAKLKRAANPAVQKFTVYFEDFHNIYIDLKDALSQIEDGETGVKFYRAIKMQLQAFLADWEEIDV